MDGYVEFRLIGRGETVEGRCRSGTTFGEVLDSLKPPTGVSTKLGGGHDWFWMNAVGHSRPILVVPQTILGDSGNEGTLEFKVDTMMTDGDWHDRDDWEDPFDLDEDEEENEDESPGGEPVIVFSDEYPAGESGWYKGTMSGDEVKLDGIDSYDGEPYHRDDFDEVVPARLNASYSGRVVSKGTLVEIDILNNYFRFQNELHEGLAEEWAVEAGPVILLAEDPTATMFDYLEEFDDWFNRIAPVGHYFGTLEGNSSEFGFWPNTEQDELVTAAVNLGITTTIRVDEEMTVGDALRQAINQKQEAAARAADRAEQASKVSLTLIDVNETGQMDVTKYELDDDGKLVVTSKEATPAERVEAIVNYWDSPAGQAEMAQLHADALRQAIREDSSMQRYLRSL